jgi:hypothetical protein
MAALTTIKATIEIKTKVSIKAKDVRLVVYNLSLSSGFLAQATFKLPKTIPVATAAKPNVNIATPHIKHLNALTRKYITRKKV